MTISINVFVICDGCGRSYAVAIGDTIYRRDVEAARRKARTHGWRRWVNRRPNGPIDSKTDLCTECRRQRLYENRKARANRAPGVGGSRAPEPSGVHVGTTQGLDSTAS
jgi:hypothetical protein